MKKILFLVAICFFSKDAFSQTAVFELNQEKARYNQSKNISQIVSNTFQCGAPVTSSDFDQISTVMKEKDGYVSCTLTAQNTLVVEHESWLETKDITDVIRLFVPVVELEAIHQTK